uniref:Uncharacterized protein n=1 Tax=Oryza meridionalis TaxID=40149 RepID=A0A0E0EV99_9ORYZ
MPSIGTLVWFENLNIEPMVVKPNITKPKSEVLPLAPLASIQTVPPQHAAHLVHYPIRLRRTHGCRSNTYTPQNLNQPPTPLIIVLPDLKTD